MEDIIIVVFLVVVVFIGVRASAKHLKGQGGCCGGSSTIKAPKKKLSKVIAKKTIIIEGMTCKHCKNRVERCINNIDGVAAKVSLRKKVAIVSFEKDINVELIRTAIEKAGYTVIEIR